MDKLFNGATLGAYRIIQQIGEGGMAKVYKAYQPSMERYVALKVLPSHYAEDPQFIERFIREARTIAALEHRNILPVYDFGEQNGITFMAMRYVEGGTLKELLNKGRITLHDTLDLILQISSALDYAHRRGVIHRDVKPSNVILDGEGAAYLMDFGIAKVLGKAGDLTATGAAIGTPAYMAPEQALGEKVDSRTDIYALGIMLYEMVVGRVPFQADTPMAVLMAHLRDPLPLPREFDASISEPVQAVIIKALSKEPRDRFQTANELAEAFRKALQTSAHREESSTLMTLIREVQTGRQAETPSAPITPGSQVAAHLTDPRLKERMEQDYIDGLSAYWIRDWVKARACFQAVMGVDPNYKDTASRLQEVEKQIQLAELYAQAQEAMSKDDWQTAMEKLRQLVALDKEYQQSAAMLKTAQLKIELGELYAQAEQLYQAGQWRAVVNIFERMRALDPNAPDPKGLLNQAKASLAEQQRLEKVRQLYQRGLEALEAGKWKEALRIFEQVRSQQPGYGDVDKLIRRVQDELNRTRQRPGLKTAVPTRAPAAKETALPSAPPPAQEAAPGEVVEALTLQTPAQPKKTSRHLWTGVLAVLILVVILGLAASVTGQLNRVALALGLLKPTHTPIPTLTPVPPNTPVPVLDLFDDFQEASINGKVDPGRWEVTGNCEELANFNRLVKDGMLLFLSKPGSNFVRCQLWALKGGRVPGVELGAFEAALNYIEQAQKGYTSQHLSFLADYEDRKLQVFCGLGTWSEGKFVRAFSVVETKNDRQTELAYQEAEAQFRHWYTTRLLLDTATMTFECRFDGQTLGTYQPENGDRLREVQFARLLEVERKAGAEARTLVDDVRLIPLPGAELWEQKQAKVVEQPTQNPLCPQVIKGWRAEYWDNAGMYGDPKVCFDVPNIHFFWEMNSPVPGKFQPNYFSARFIRSQEFEGGMYRFRLGGDDGVRLWVDDKLIIDQWHSQPYTIYSADVRLTPGTHELKLLYFEAEMSASLTLEIEKDPDRLLATTQSCISPSQGLLDWWGGDGDGSNVRPGPELALLNGVQFVAGMVNSGFQFESQVGGKPAYAPAKTFDQRLRDAQRLTIETWVMLNATSPGDKDPNRLHLLEKVLGSVERFVSLGDEAVLRKEEDGRLHFYVKIDGQLRHVWSEKVLPRNEFIHVAGVYDGKRLTLYWNGVKVGESEISGKVAPISELYLSSDTEPLFGVLDEVSIYNTALSGNEINAIYRAGPRGKCK